MNLAAAHIGIIGLGYVGLPLAVEFGKHFPTLGFDLKTKRVEQLRVGLDITRETHEEDLRAARLLSFTTDPGELATCNVYIVTVPTPIDRYKRPDLTPLKLASEIVGTILKPGDVVVYESTVYPGCTEEVCVPILEQKSGLAYASGANSPMKEGDPNTSPNSKNARHFFVGYSHERINPGDKDHRLTNIKKVTSGSTPEAARFVDALYRSIIVAGTHLAPAIRVAEAAKVIENTQRDVNIALINELAMLFHRLGLDTEAVLAAAGSKWNFLPFRPGLVGGHCIGVDPYYLTHKAQEIGYHPEMILAGRRINDGMGAYVAQRITKLMALRDLPIHGARILILGLTFKENCPDLRNTRVVDLIEELRGYGARIEVHDPWADPSEAHEEHGIDLMRSEPISGRYQAIVLAVAHSVFKDLGVATLRQWGQPNAVIYDVKHLYPPDQVDGRL